MQHPEIVVKRNCCMLQSPMLSQVEKCMLNTLLAFSFGTLDLVAFPCMDTLISVMLYTQILSQTIKPLLKEISTLRGTSETHTWLAFLQSVDHS